MKMINSIKNDDTVKLGMGYRVLSSLISICSLLAIFSILLFGREESVTIASVAISLMPVVLLYICVPIVITGRPPKLFRWAARRS